MLNHAEIAPVMACRFAGGNAGIPAVVDELLSQRQAWLSIRRSTPDALELLGLALNEVLHTIVEFSGSQDSKLNSGVELWVEETLVILCVHFSGRELPAWLLRNWDRAQEPAVLAPPEDIGWGWLLVREAMDSVTASQRDNRHILFLEKRF